jgi:hypothetical protein
MHVEADHRAGKTCGWGEPCCVPQQGFFLGRRESCASESGGGGGNGKALPESWNRPSSGRRRWWPPCEQSERGVGGRRALPDSPSRPIEQARVVVGGERNLFLCLSRHLRAGDKRVARPREVGGWSQRCACVSEQAIEQERGVVGAYKQAGGVWGAELCVRVGAGNIAIRSCGWAGDKPFSVPQQAFWEADVKKMYERGRWGGSRRALRACRSRP